MLNKKMALKLSSLLLLAGIHTAHAGVIDFETTTSGAAVVDNQVFSGQYADGSTFVTFGMDMNHDRVIDADVYYEAYGDDALDAYASNPAADADNSDGRLGKGFFLRAASDGTDAPLDGGSFLVAYSGVLPTAASGSIWDVDGPEIFTINALDAAGTILSTVVLADADGGDGLPATFAFDLGAGNNISYIDITNNSTRPMGFDNFSATTAVNVSVPEPAMLMLFPASIFLLGWSRRSRKVSMASS
ncbi:MAG: hypothetical protein GQ582_04285 [Methyloprofundus sp.]|nr:hypothetical protein [Methyloprofundus sp.]